MTLYLLDENVFREMWEGGDARVRAWQASVLDADLRLSVMTLHEKRLGWERLRKSDPERAARGLAGIDALEAVYAGRIVPIDEAVAAEWAKLLGAKQKNQRDMAIAATARVHGMVVVTRNVRDFAGRGVRVLDPFRAGAGVEVV